MVTERYGKPDIPLHPTVDGPFAIQRYLGHFIKLHLVLVLKRIQRVCNAVDKPGARPCRLDKITLNQLRQSTSHGRALTSPENVRRTVPSNGTFDISSHIQKWRLAWKPSVYSNDDHPLEPFQYIDGFPPTEHVPRPWEGLVVRRINGLLCFGFALAQGCLVTRKQNAANVLQGL